MKAKIFCYDGWLYSISIKREKDYLIILVVNKDCQDIFAYSMSEDKGHDDSPILREIELSQDLLNTVIESKAAYDNFKSFDNKDDKADPMEVMLPFLNASKKLRNLVRPILESL